MERSNEHTEETRASNCKNDEQHKSEDTEVDVAIKGAIFDEAIGATGFGKFHYLLYLGIIPASWASSFDTSTASMIVPSAECDLNMTLFQKGVLNASVYGGMVASALLWGFVSDTFGRKPIVFYGYLLDGIFNILSGLSQNFYVLTVFKFICGFIVSGPHASAMSYCAEFNTTKDRPRITMFIGSLITAGSIVGAVLALLIIPQDWSFSYNGFAIHSWQIYLIVTGLIILFGALCIGFFPESPKFMMSQGRNEEALDIFQQIYSMNSGKQRKTYPVKVLENEVAGKSSLDKDTQQEKSFGEYLHDGLLQMKPLFLGSYLPKLLLMITIQFCGMLSNNTIRLWQPQLFAFLTESNADNETEVDFSFCNLIDRTTFARLNESMFGNIDRSLDNVTCVKKPVDESVYTNTIIISAASLSLNFLAVALVGTVKNKHLLLFCFFVATCSAVALNWSRSVIVTLVLISTFVGLLRATVNLLIGCVVNIFPTSMRTTAVSLTMMFGRLGSLLGNILFPIFLEYGCTVALMSLAAMELVAFILTMFIPNAKENVK